MNALAADTSTRELTVFRIVTLQPTLPLWTIIATTSSDVTFYSLIVSLDKHTFSSYSLFISRMQKIYIYFVVSRCCITPNSKVSIIRTWWTRQRRSLTIIPYLVQHRHALWTNWQGCHHGSGLICSLCWHIPGSTLYCLKWHLTTRIHSNTYVRIWAFP